MQTPKTIKKLRRQVFPLFLLQLEKKFHFAKIFISKKSFKR